MGLETYNEKRDFRETVEPRGAPSRENRHRFVVQEHHASHLHFDFRLEMDGVLKSWAVPKGPSLDPKQRRLAVMTEDHPVKYLTFEGHIPEGNYGAGDMVVWDTGQYEAIGEDKHSATDPVTGWEKGKLRIRLHGDKLHGDFNLFRIRGEDQWLLTKAKDEYADPGWQLETVLNDGAAPAAPAQGARTKSRKTSRAKPIKAASSIRKAKTTKATEGPIPGAHKARLPAQAAAMLATLVDRPPDAPEWLYELKWDGFRALGFIDKGKARLISRNQKELTPLFPELAQALEHLPVKQAIVDGEIVALDKQGRPSFQRLQNRTGLKPKKNREAPAPVVFYAFDLLYCDGYDLRQARLTDRKQWLEKLIAGSEPSSQLQYSAHVTGQGAGPDLLRQAGKQGLEGIMAKHPDSHYIDGRSEEWLKIKLVRRQEAVIAGYTEPRRTRPYFGAVILGLYKNGDLHYVGHSGSGFDRDMLQQLYDKMQALEVATSPFAEPPRTNEAAHWIEPKLVCEVKFTEWTDDARMRHPIFLGLRPDKAPKECRFERPRDTAEATAAHDAEQSDAKTTTRAGRSKGKHQGTAAIDIEEALAKKKLTGDLTVRVGEHEVRLTHLEKVYWPEEGYTKGDLIRYYYRMAGVILPHLKDRPLILKRYPNGIDKQFFFQHNVEAAPDFVRTVAIEEQGRLINYAVGDNVATLLYLANLGTIAQNPWLSRLSKIDCPDWIVFDLDPGDVPFAVVSKVALAIRGVLAAAQLEAYAKTSGSAGIHVYVPIAPVYSYDEAGDFATLVAKAVQAQHPDIVTLERSIGERPPRTVYLDTMQNEKGKSVAAPWSVREKPGATVSAPLTWEEVERVPKIGKYTIRTMPARYKKLGDLFRPVLETKQKLGNASKILARLATDKP
jgi:bifunctional non-homologous end joining protein LigD